MKDSIRTYRKENFIIEVDDDYAIEVDALNWTVWKRGVIKKTTKTKDENVGKTKWDDIGYCRDLPAALKCIIRAKAAYRFDTEAIDHFLSWQDSTIHSMLDRVLRKDTELKRALEYNKVIISQNNFE